MMGLDVSTATRSAPVGASCALASGDGADTICAQPSIMAIDGQVVQPVRMIDGEGRAWLALYPMQRQPDGSWRTNCCQLGRLAGQQI